MRIMRVEKNVITAQAVPKAIQTGNKLSAPEMNAILQVKAQLNNVPGMPQMLQNPTNLTFLMEFFQILNTNQNARTLILTALSTISNFMKKNPTETSSVLTKN